MCRLLAGKGSLDKELIARLRELSHKHDDGWGAVWWSSSQNGHVKSSLAAYQPGSGFSQVAEVLQRLNDGTYICHVRKASVAPTLVANSHPFVKDGWAFAHNGSLPWLEMGKRTDSEEYFESELLPGLTAGHDPVEVIGQAVKRAQPTYTSLNSVLSDGRRLYVLEAHLIKPEYYTLYWQADDSGVRVASAGIASADWAVLGNGNLLVVDGRVSKVSILR